MAKTVTVCRKCHEENCDGNCRPDPPEKPVEAVDEGSSKPTSKLTTATLPPPIKQPDAITVEPWPGHLDGYQVFLYHPSRPGPHAGKWLLGTISPTGGFQLGTGVPPACGVPVDAAGRIVVRH